ncbi:class I SAM-dependent methyltransferase [Thalassococcus sp. BH17M4-6]|uniref:class I SAM-dependent methyltransferase n=1 Tax=Thalassococcus sp. BH17M4-6 TaxID=3413148 RepID=UPI003BE6A618
MATSRLTTLLDNGTPRLPDTGRILLLGPQADTDLSALPRDRCHVVQTFRPDHDALAARGFDCATAPDGPYAAAVVFLPRARELGQSWIAQACTLTDGPVVVDGQKTDGIESMLKHLRPRVALDGQISKAHGKAFWFGSTDALADWAGPETLGIDGGWHTAPGVFSADGVDPASQLLAGSLPRKLGPAVADLGAGWGYLSARMLERDDIQTLHLVEADHTALDCARLNVTDDRARFHWADVPGWEFPERLDAVVMNPPFHTGRKADPALGRAFIAAAARMLKPTGQLWLVANRHLPYETELGERFAQVTEAAGDNRFKVLQAQRPTRARR